MDASSLVRYVSLIPQFPVVALAVGFTTYGLVLLFFGYRLFRLLATFTGLALVGALAVGLSMHYLPGHVMQHYLLGLLGAGIGAAVFYYVSVFGLGAVLGAGVAHLIGWAWLASRGYEDSAAAQNGMFVSYVVAGLTAGVMAIVFKRLFLILLTSAGGAALAIVGASLLAGGLPAVIRSFGLLGGVLTGLTLLVLAGIGFFAQIRVTAAGTDEDAEEDDDEEDEKPKKKQARKKSRKKD